MPPLLIPIKVSDLLLRPVNREALNEWLGRLASGNQHDMDELTARILVSSEILPLNVLEHVLPYLDINTFILDIRWAELRVLMGREVSGSVIGTIKKPELTKINEVFGELVILNGRLVDWVDSIYLGTEPNLISVRNSEDLFYGIKQWGLLDCRKWGEIYKPGVRVTFRPKTLTVEYKRFSVMITLDKPILNVIIKGGKGLCFANEWLEERDKDFKPYTGPVDVTGLDYMAGLIPILSGIREYDSRWRFMKCRS